LPKNKGDDSPIRSKGIPGKEVSMKGSMRNVIFTACVLTLSATSAPVSAWAGFQWTAPAASAFTPSATQAQGRPAELPPRPAAAPIAPVQTESLPASMAAISAGAPVPTQPDGPASAAPIYGNGMTNDPITWNQPMNAQAPRAPQNLMAAAPAPVMAAPVAPVMSSDPMASAAPMMAAPISSGYDVTEGFGKDLPLVMAIRQIVPAQYGFVFDQNIDTQAHVSWQGGQPWDIVLQNTLAPLNMQASINGNVVSITKAAPAMMPGVQMASVTAPAATVATQTVQTTTTTTMAPTPIAMTSAPAMPPETAMPNPNYAPTRMPSADLLATGTWTAPRNSSLRGILQDWSERAGVELYWASEYDYPIQSAVSLNGTFEEAVQTLLKGLADSKPRPMGRLHPNLPNGPAVLVIETRQNSM
jgi:hypothetical protein